ncbi:MAG TPA: hemin uptake protein HemP [Paracoccaceae bacterium]|nr:hemin uptake protein HemP [Paracoccaceae bacterium]
MIESSALFGEARTVSIRHGAELYTLRITRADKLILTK